MNCAIQQNLTTKQPPLTLISVQKKPAAQPSPIENLGYITIKYARHRVGIRTSTGEHFTVEGEWGVGYLFSDGTKKILKDRHYLKEAKYGNRFVHAHTAFLL